MAQEAYAAQARDQPPSPTLTQGQARLETVIWVPKKRRKCDVGGTECSLPLHHIMHENSEVQRGEAIIPRSHSLPAPGSMDLAARALIHNVQPASMVGSQHGKTTTSKMQTFTEKHGFKSQLHNT